jgi:hypothetical protein
MTDDDAVEPTVQALIDAQAATETVLREVVAQLGEIARQLESLNMKMTYFMGRAAP